MDTATAANPASATHASARDLWAPAPERASDRSATPPQATGRGSDDAVRLGAIVLTGLALVALAWRASQRRREPVPALSPTAATAADPAPLELVTDRPPVVAVPKTAPPARPAGPPAARPAKRPAKAPPAARPAKRPAKAPPAAPAAPRPAKAPPAAPAPATGIDPPGPEPGRHVLGYISRRPAERDADVPGLVEQEALIREASDRHGWRLVDVVCDDMQGLDDVRDPPGLVDAVSRLGPDEVPCLVVSHLDRLGRSAVEIGTRLEELSARGATLVSLDYGIDTSSQTGGLVTDVLAHVAAWERDKIATGTRQGLAAARARGKPISRPSVTDQPGLRERIVAMRGAGMTLQAIADTLNAEGVPTLRGGALWRPSSVQAATGYKRPRAEGGPRRRGRGGDGADGGGGAGAG